jgi:hypothetical protein
MRRCFAAAFAAVLVLSLAVPVTAAPAGVKFDLAVDHPEGTTLNPTEVVYTATPAKGGIGGNLGYVLRHECHQDGSPIVTTSKGLWFSGHGAGDYGTAYFFTFGDTCSGVVLDIATGLAVSPVVTYETDPLP